MANIPPIQFKRTDIAGRKPSAAQLRTGELALNLADKLIYTRDSDGNVFAIGGSGGGITAVDSEGVLANFDSDGFKHKELLVFLINKRKLITWDSEIDDYVDVGGAGSGAGTVRTFDSEAILLALASSDSDEYKVKESIYVIKNERKIVAWDSDVDQFVAVSSGPTFYEDFTLTSATAPVKVTVTNPLLNQITDGSSLVVSFQGYPMIPGSYGVSKTSGAWVITLIGDSDFAGNTYEIGDTVRVSNTTVIGNQGSNYGFKVSPNGLSMSTGSAPSYSIECRNDLWIANETFKNAPPGTTATVYTFENTLNSAAYDYATLALSATNVAPVGTGTYAPTFGSSVAFNQSDTNSPIGIRINGTADDTSYTNRQIVWPSTVYNPVYNGGQSTRIHIIGKFYQNSGSGFTQLAGLWDTSVGEIWGQDQLSMIFASDSGTAVSFENINSGGTVLSSGTFSTSSTVYDYFTFDFLYLSPTQMNFKIWRNGTVVYSVTGVTFNKSFVIGSQRSANNRNVHAHIASIMVETVGSANTLTDTGAQEFPAVNGKTIVDKAELWVKTQSVLHGTVTNGTYNNDGSWKKIN